jgi:hypothetical protein
MGKHNEFTRGKPWQRVNYEQVHKGIFTEGIRNEFTYSWVFLFFEGLVESDGNLCGFWLSKNKFSYSSTRIGEHTSRTGNVWFGEVL